MLLIVPSCWISGISRISGPGCENAEPYLPDLPTLLTPDFVGMSDANDVSVVGKDDQQPASLLGVADGIGAELDDICERDE